MEKIQCFFEEKERIEKMLSKKRDTNYIILFVNIFFNAEIGSKEKELIPHSNKNPLTHAEKMLPENVLFFLAFLKLELFQS